MNCPECSKLMEYFEEHLWPTPDHWYCPDCSHVLQAVELICCQACSRARGADMPVYHRLPECRDS